MLRAAWFWWGLHNALAKLPGFARFLIVRNRHKACGYKLFQKTFKTQKQLLLTSARPTALAVMVLVACGTIVAVTFARRHSSFLTYVLIRHMTTDSPTGFGS